MVGKLAGVVFAVSTLHASVVSALGLGEIKLMSGLNQPLQAQIELNNLGDLDPEQVAIKLAGAEDFSRAGVERVFFLNDLKFAVTVDGKGGGVVKVSSSKLVREPYLDFVVEARWPDGRLLRGYTLLVDMPVFADMPAQAASPAATRQVTPTPQAKIAAPARRPAPAASQAAIPAPAPAPLSGEIVTQKNDTLWGIASQARPRGASMQQAMMAIYRSNPDAFTRQNINGLRSGQVLRLPSREQIDEMSKQQAIQAVAMQNEAWRTGTTAPLEAADTAVVQDETAQAPADSYMKLSSAASTETSESGASAGGEQDPAVETQAVRSELVAAQEKLDQASRENAELDSRLDEMEGQVDTLAKLVELKDSQLAALQARLEQESAAAATAAPTDQNYAADTVAPVAATQVTQPAPVADEPGLMDRLMSPLYLGGLGALALLGLAGLALKRRNNEDDPEELAVAGGEVAEPFVVTDALAAKVRLQKPGTAPGAEFDPLSEAEVYCSYDRHEEAISMLQQAIGKEPERTELQLKLLSILVDLDRKDEFVQAYAQLERVGSEDSLELAQQLVMGKGWLDPAAQDAEPNEAVTDEAVTSEIDNADLDFDLDFDLDESLNLDDTAQHKSVNLGIDDLQLDQDGDNLDLELPKTEKSGMDTALDDLEFDLDLGDDDAEELDNAALTKMLDAGDNIDNDNDDELSEIGDGDEIATKLDLARAYVDMGDVDGAREILDEVLQDGSQDQVQEANELLRDLAG
jgi:pilus assembly protein FimV